VPEELLRSSRLASPRAALVLASATLAAAVAAVPLSLATHTVSNGVPVIPFGIVGAIVARRQSQNPIGWIMLGLSFVFLVSCDAGQYAVLVYHRGDSGLPLARVAVFLAAGWVWLLVLLPLPIGLFPDGRVEGRWRLLLRAYVVFATVFIVMVIFEDAAGIVATRIRIDSTGELARFDGSNSSIADNVALLGYFGFCVLWVARQLLAFRRSTGVRREQLKWLLSGGAICIIGLVVTLTAGGSDYLALRFLENAGFAGLAALPIGLGVGILRYRLYEIDRLLSRTLAYAIVTGLLVGVFFGVVLVTTDVLPFSSPIGVAASTFAAAALFDPLRRRVQRLVDRRFNRARYDAESTVAGFTSELRDAVELDSVRIQLLAVVERAVEPTHVSLWIRPD
jgi:hypothetical protein